MVSEENMDFLRQREARYLVGTPKSQLRKFEREYLEQEDWAEVQPGVEVKLVPHPDGQGQEQYVLCRSVDRAKKEAAMLQLKRTRLLAKLHDIDRALRKRPQKLEAAARRIGRWLGRYPAAERCVEVEILQDPANGKAMGLSIQEKEAPASWAQHAHGGYLLRTNCLDQDPAKLWSWYIQLTKAEEAFCISKTDLNLRPVFHQKTERVEAHILVCFLTLALWRTLEMWMRAKGMGHCSRQLLKEVATVRSMDVTLPVRNQGEITLRVVSKPDQLVAELLAHLGLHLPSVPKPIENVVEKIAAGSS
jgi:hypothetical protein